MRPKPDWTVEQRAAIDTTGRSLLVSAAAGSGKTAVLAERCAQLVCKDQNHCDVDELLVVTFTEAAAAEMKGRIQEAIRDKIAARSDPRLIRQLALIDRMQVSTLHGFCARLIRQHFHLLNLDPAFSVLDGDEAGLLRTEIARQLFADRYEADSEGTFQAFVDAYGDGNDEPLVHQVIKTHELLTSLADPAAWMRQAMERIDSACEGKLDESRLGKDLIALVAQRLADLRHRCTAAQQSLWRMDGFAKYVEQLGQIGRELDSWQDLLHDRGLDALCEAVGRFEPPTLPKLSNALPGKNVAKSLIDSVRDELKDGKLAEILRFNCSQWTAGMRSMQPSARVFLELVDEFARRYRAEKDANRTVDFSDLERLTLKALSGDKPASPSPVARLLHKQFKHVLVDEYQDINEVQNAILTLASTECIAADDTASNLFCVGDVKQSIYRFRLAEPELFLTRYRTFRNSTRTGTVIDLQSNFRSRGPLLDSLNEIFQRLMTQHAADIEYDASHRLNPGLKYPSANGAMTFTGSPLELHLLPDDPAARDDHDEDAPQSADEQDLERSGREALLIAQRILALTGKDGTSPPMHVMERIDGVLTPRPIRMGDIVILLRSMRYKADQYAEIIRAAGIALHSESATGYFESMEVRDMLALLKVLDNRRQDVPLAAFLRSPIACLAHPEDSLARIRLAYPSSRIAFHEAVFRYAREQDDELAARLRDILKTLHDWREMAQRRPLAELLWDVYDSTGYLAFCSGLADGPQRVANLIDLHERARQFGSFHRQGLARFLSFLDTLADESDLGQPSVVSGAEDVVRIMSIHRSKGLEFPVVILPDLGKTINMSDCSGSILVDRHAYLGLSAIDEQKQIRYPSLASMLLEQRLRQQTLAEELRVLYVAMTRAKEHLILVGTVKDKTCDNWQSRWSDHGPSALPSDTILSARTMLDWLGPITATTPHIFDMHRYSPDELAAWPTPEAMRPKETARLERLARLEKLSSDPEKSEAAQAVIDRLATRYPFEPFTKVPAALSVTKVAKEGRAAPAAHSPALEPIVEFKPSLAMPRSLETDLKPTATEIGTATHLLLEHLDFTRCCDSADLAAQLQSLIERRLISPNAARSVDLDSICWLVTSPIGKLIRDHPASVHRELPVYFPRNPEGSSPSQNPLDRIMIRSRIDVLVPTSRGYEVIDYKTDQVTPETVHDRIGFYQQQMSLYREAVEAVLGRPPMAIHLVFLSPRLIHTCSGTGLQPVS